MPRRARLPDAVRKLLMALYARGIFLREDDAEEAATLAPTVRWDPDLDRWTISDPSSGDWAALHETRDDALAAVEESPWGKAAKDRKKPDRVFRAGWSWRWFDSTSTEDLPAVDGTQLTERDLDDMVRNLAARKKPIEIRGAYVTSEGHEAGKGAAGWAFLAVKVIEPDGKPHMWLRGCVNPDVEDALASGRVLYGSIGFIPESVDPYSQEPIGTELHHYALLNDSYRDDLEPHAPVPRGRAEGGASIPFMTTSDLAHPGDPVLTRSHPRALSPRRGPMPAKTIRSNPAHTIRVLRMKQGERTAMLAAALAALALGPELSDEGVLDALGDPAKRGPAKDKLEEILRILKIEKPADDPNWDPWWQVSQTISALQSAAKVEDILSTEPAADAGARGAPGQKPAQRAEGEGDAGNGEGDAAATSDLMALLRRVLGLAADAPLADVLDKAKAAEDALKGAVNPGGDGDQAGGGDDAGGMRAEDRAAAIALRSEVATLRKAVEDQGVELATLRREKRKATLTGRVSKLYADCKLRLEDADRDELVDLMLEAKDDATAERILKRAIPEAFRSQGRDSEAMPDGGANRGAPPGEGGTATARSRAIEAELPEEIRKSLGGRAPYTAAEKRAWQEATLAAEAKNPKLFSDAASSAVGD